MNVCVVSAVFFLAITAGADSEECFWKGEDLLRARVGSNFGQRSSVDGAVPKKQVKYFEVNMDQLNMEDAFKSCRNETGKRLTILESDTDKKTLDLILNHAADGEKYWVSYAFDVDHSVKQVEVDKEDGSGKMYRIKNVKPRWALKEPTPKNGLKLEKHGVTLEKDKTGKQLEWVATPRDTLLPYICEYVTEE